MSLKNLLNALNGKKTENELVRKDQAAQTIMNGDDFPIYCTKKG